MTEMKLLHILAGLNGLLKKVRDLGIPLVSVNRIAPDPVVASALFIAWYAWTWPNSEGQPYRALDQGESGGNS
jgi:hypothetical protein